MNKLLFLSCCLFLILPAQATPILEISEFGNSKPLIKLPLKDTQKEFSTSNWKCTVKKQSNKINIWELSFKSDLQEPSRLAVKFTLPLSFTPLRFWDGNKEHSVKKDAISRKIFLEAFPLATVENGKQGVSLGFAPNNILSEFSRQLKGNSLILSTRIVVDNKKIQKLTIVEYNFIPEFGWRNAVEDYYQAFPEYFTTTPNIDNRIYGVSGYLTGAHKQRRFQLHSARKTRIQWEWTYAPWYESGNWYAVGQGWQKEKNEYRNYNKIRQHAMLTQAEYDYALKHQMDYGNKAAALFFYILVKDIHQNLAKNYPNAVQGPSGLHSLPSNRGKTRSVFAPGTPLFDYLKNQLKQIVENYEVSGFSFDMANSSYHFTTQSQLDYAVGRSWYDNGKIYTSDTVVPIPFADYIHTLKRNNKTMGTVFNAALSKFSPFTFFHTDAAIMEGPPHYNYSVVLPLRLIMGKKPLTFWHPYDTASTGIMTEFVANNPAKKNEINHGLKLFYLLKCYELGINPMNWVTNDVFYHKHLPILEKLSKAGYHPVPAIKDANPFWVGRFGDGNKTILTFSNPKREKITKTVKVLTKYLGKNKYAFIPLNGTLKQQIINGVTTFNLTLNPKEIVVLQAIEITGNVKQITTVKNNLTTTIIADNPFIYKIVANDLSGNQIINCDKDICENKATNQTVIPYYPSCGIFASKTKLISFLDNNKFPNIEAGNDEDTKIAAQMVAMYRPHVKACLQQKGEINTREPGLLDASLCKEDLSIVAPSQGKTILKICVGTIKDFPNFQAPQNHKGPFLSMPNSNTLWIGGYTSKDIKKSADVYFLLLDEKYSASVKVDFKRPSHWGGNGKFVNKGKQKYLQIIGNPQHKNNNFLYSYYPIKNIKSNDEISFSTSCKVEKISSGTIQVGIYEFSDKDAKKYLRFQSVNVKASPNWQTISGKFKLHKKTQSARFYYLCRNLGENDIFEVRNLELLNNTK